MTFPQIQYRNKDNIWCTYPHPFTDRADFLRVWTQLVRTYGAVRRA